MHKYLKRVVRISLYVLLVFILSLGGIIGYMYFSADMCIPEITEKVPDHKLIIEDNYRQWGENYLRKSESGLWELKVTGSDYERGTAIGKMSEDLLYYQEKVFVDQIKEIVPSGSYLRFLGFFTILYNRNLGKNVPEEYRREIYGVSQACSDEFDYISTPYERQLNYHAAHDLGHAMQDYMLVGCSSFATWGSQSTDSTLIIGRNFDFYVGDDFAKNKEVLFYEPDKGYKFVSIAWPGMTGVLSGMNEEGLTVTINAAKSSIPTSAKTPISILTREILQYASTIEDAYEIAKKRETFVSESILIGSAKDKKAAIIEKSPDNIGLFTTSEERIICTNHFQSDIFANDERNLENIRTTDSNYRYKRLTELLDKNKPIDEKKVASILRNTKGLKEKEIGLTNEMAINQFIAHHSVIFKPEQRIIWVSTHPWQIGKYVAYDLNKIFKGNPDFRKEIYSDEYTIAEDSLRYNNTYTNLIAYKDLTKDIKIQIKEKSTVTEDMLKMYEATNPEYYHMYEIIGDYYDSQGDKNKAKIYWKKALTKEIPKISEKERILKKIK
ncbi:choloylglycine hydrolase [Dysgonomonas sp. Marseille-P4677]|uniref:C45 family autoproteolytic acyltransferase/hydolase n=1 Tax=Dysgonomonas sp. Marseille-P4677 TaxID=2364790 RepID=UPI0019114C08|nr:C45 family peptidase [Dysgonomonas sp. Marseille-P4677]MBK5720107.1 choloylglycine hydrolase [Dysgonomonas sp. Marseille-P4677]